MIVSVYFMFALYNNGGAREFAVNLVGALLWPVVLVWVVIDMYFSE
jgi:hypothetical protein